MSNEPRLTALDVRVVIQEILERSLRMLERVDPDMPAEAALLEASEQFHHFGRQLSGLARRLRPPTE